MHERKKCRKQQYPARLRAEKDICASLRKLGRILRSLKHPLLALSSLFSILFKEVLPLGYVILVFAGVIAFDFWHFLMTLFLRFYITFEEHFDGFFRPH